MKSVCIVQARLGSTRLPGKVLLPLNGHTVIGEVLTRCKRIPGVDEVVCAIPSREFKLADECLKFVSVMYGSESDVLERYCEAAESCGADIIMRITGDCPLISPELCGEVLATFKREGADYASNIEPRTFPKGLDCEVFSRNLLFLANDEDHEREHVTTWMRSARPWTGVKRVNVASPWPIDGRMTLDTMDDYKTICAAFGHEPYDTYKRLRAA
jgi:spore coat polysaccharide biosynthesis protein SpsF